MKEDYGSVKAEWGRLEYGENMKVILGLDEKWWSDQGSERVEAAMKELCGEHCEGKPMRLLTD